MRKTLYVLMALAAGSTASAAITTIAGDTVAPPATLGSYAMTPFDPDGRTVGGSVSFVESPLGGALGFSEALYHWRIAQGWATWSNGYTGDVYSTFSSGPFTLTLPAGTLAFYLYVEPNTFGVSEFTVQVPGGATLVSSVGGVFDAKLFAAYATDGDFISRVIITADSSAGGFAIGEFGIASTPKTPTVPAPGALLLATLGTALVGALRRRRSL